MSAFMVGFLDEMEKLARENPGLVDKIRSIGRSVSRSATSGAEGAEGTAGKVWGGAKGAAKGLKRSFKRYPGMFLAPAAAYAGYQLLKGLGGRRSEE